MKLQENTRSYLHTLPGKLPREIISALLALPLVLLLSLTVLQYGWRILNHLADPEFLAHTAIGLLFAAGILALFIVILRREKPFPPVVFLCCSLLIAILLYVGYASSVQVAWINDFEDIWQIAVGMVQNGDYQIHDLQRERTLPVLVPMLLLFDAGREWVPAINIIMLLLMQLLGYDIVRRALNHRAAQAFVVLWLAAMEPLVAMLIPSHDIWGLFYLVIFFWGFRLVSEGNGVKQRGVIRRSLLAGIGVIVLATVLVLLEMQREILPMVAVGLIFGWLMFAWNPEANATLLRRVLATATIVLVVTMLAIIALKTMGIMTTSGQDRWLYALRIGAYSSSFSDGDYATGWAMYKTFFRLGEEVMREGLIPTLPLSDYALQPAARLEGLFARAAPMAELGSQDYFYLAGAVTSREWLLPVIKACNTAIALLLAALGLLVLPFVMMRLRLMATMLPLAFLGTLITLLLLFGESQPRYLFPVWFILPLLIAVAFESARGAPVLKATGYVAWGKSLLRGTLVLVVVYFLIGFVWRAIYSEQDGRILSGWSPGFTDAQAQAPDGWFRDNQALVMSIDPDDERQVPRVHSSNYGDLDLVLRIPVAVGQGASVTASKQVCTSPGRRALEFFYGMPEPDIQDAATFSLQVSADGKARWQHDLAEDETIRHVRIENLAPPGECVPLEFRLTSNAALSDPDASQVRIYFPRLAR